ncbi:MAG: thioredoxin family protein [Hyphomonadaceae bacterium]|nr:thioredoxin family protein [Hyphomonadaceae bacterium]
MMRVLIMALMALCAALSARAEPYDGGHARVELISERQVALPGETLYLALDKTLDPDWHVYWRNAGDAGLPPEIFWEDDSPLGERTRDADFTWPLPKLLPVVEGEIMDYGYDDALTLPFQVTIPEDAVGSIRFQGVADYLICKDICIPETAPVSLTIFIGEAQEPNLAHAEKIAAALASAPVPFEGEAVAMLADEETLQLSLAPGEATRLDGQTLRFFPYENEIFHALAQSQSVGANGASLNLPKDPREPLGEALAGVIAATAPDGTRTGYIIRASITDAPLAGTYGTPFRGQSGAASRTSVNLLLLAGLALLGGLVLNLMPCVLPVLTIKAMGMVSAASKGEDAHLRAHGLWYTAGVLISFAALAAAFVALRSMGEFWALGSLLQYPIIVAVLAMGAFLLGLWLLGMFEAGGSLQNLGAASANRGGVIGAFATGALAATAGAPCVGPFVGASLGAVLERPAPEVFFIYLMLGLGQALPFLVLSFVPGLARHLPKPGAWMERVKQFFAFPMFLSAAALLFVLGDQAGTGAVAWLVMGAALVAFGIWALKTAGGRLKPIAMVAGALALIGGLSLPLSTARTLDPSETSSTAYAARYETEPWSPERVAELTAEGRGVFVDFTATWCMICQANKRTTLTKPDVLAAMEAANITFLVADFTNKDPVIAEELKQRGRPGVPMYLLYGPGQHEPALLPQTLSPALMKREIAAVRAD